MATNPKVLIIDEDLDSRVETRRALQRAHLEIAAEVGFGTQAVTLAAETKPDAILVAVEEPVTRPLETVEALANVLPETPVLFYSSLADVDAARRAVLAGARDYLLKPLTAATLQYAVFRALEFEEKRHMRQAGQLAGQAVRGTVITVAGAKGGIGKSVIAVNLALALREKTGGRVVIVDADTHFGDVATMLDLTPEKTAGQLLDALDKADRTTVNEYLSQIEQGLTVLAGPMESETSWEAGGPEAPRKIVDLLALSHDFVVVDTSGAMDSYVRNLIEASTLVLLVTTGEVSSVRDTKQALIRLKGWGVADDKVKLLLNRGARAEGFQVSDLEKSLDRPLFWEMPRDREVGRSIQVGRPLVLDKPKAAAARNILALAEAIGGNVRLGAAAAPATQNGASHGGLLERLRSIAPKPAATGAAAEPGSAPEEG